MSFVHLHTHSEYSLLDGANRIPDLVGKVRELGMDSLAITDHGNLHAAWSFYQQAKTQGIRPILGFEAYVAFGPRQERERPSWAPANYSHLVLLAKNQRGYRNLIALSSAGHVEGYYRRPRIDRQLLAERADGIVCLAACLSGEVALWLRRGNYERARETAEWFARTFGPDGYWLEVQDHGIDDERVVRDGMFQLGEDLGLPIVATNDAHYLEREDHEAHDCLLAIGTGKDLDDPNRFRFFGSESYVKTEAEMAELFPGRPDVLENTAQVAALCEFDFEKRYFLPAFPREDPSQSEEDLLVALARAGSARRYGDPLPAAVEERLTYELGVITKTGYSGYFLIVQDFIAAARARGIPVGPGRGSAAGSLVAYALGITDIDPLKFDLLFERFLNPERVSMPDIDVDFCFERRGEVIEYVRERYGRDSVGQIITFGTLKARAAVRDIARVLGVSVAEADRIAKLIPSSPGYQLSVSEAVQRVPELRELVRDNPTLERLADLACRVEGLARHASVHAAGVVIAPGPLHEYVPVCRPPQRGSAANGDETIITQYDMVALEKVGMLKMDFLGLKTLTVIHDALESIERRHGTTLDLATLDLNDPDTYVLLRAGRTAGVFQFESSLATDMLRQLRVDRFDDLVATNALVRPGPLDSGMHQRYTRRKRGEEEVRYPLPELEGVLAPTYGVILYQEQVMRIAHELAGFSLAEADVMRKAVGKKDQELIDRELRHFAERCVERGHPRRVIDDLVGQIATFGRYGFNKSHSVAYSLLSFQTAWLKAHYPAPFMAAVISSDMQNTDKVVIFIEECRKMKLAPAVPDVNSSEYLFTVNAAGEIVYGLGAVKGVGEGPIEAIVQARQDGQGNFRDIFDFCERVGARKLNKRVMEALVRSGALDRLGASRAVLFEAIPDALKAADQSARNQDAGMFDLFGEMPVEEAREPYADYARVREWTDKERLTGEKDTLGLYLTGHPIDEYEKELSHFVSKKIIDVQPARGRQQKMAGLVVDLRLKKTKKGDSLCFVTLDDRSARIDVTLYGEAYEQARGKLNKDAVLIIEGEVAQDDYNGGLKVKGSRVMDICEARAQYARCLEIRCDSQALAGRRLKQLAELLSSHRGDASLPVTLRYRRQDAEASLPFGAGWQVQASDELVLKLMDQFGVQAVALRY